jgi:hypothetical protein
MQLYVAAVFDPACLLRLGTKIVSTISQIPTLRRLRHPLVSGDHSLIFGRIVT